MKDIVRGFVEALLWVSNDGESETSFEDRADVRGIAPACMERIEKGCEAFLSSLAALDHVPTHHAGYTADSEQGGHDLFLTAAGHGCGFWDGDWTHGEELTKLAEEACGWVEHVDYFVNIAGQVEF